MKKKIIAGICIVLGIAITVVPFYYHFHGQQETDKLMEQFEQSLEDDGNESEEEVAEVSEEGTSISEEDCVWITELFLQFREAFFTILVKSTDCSFIPGFSWYLTTPGQVVFSCRVH